MGGDRTKHCWKMKWMHRTHLGSMRMKCDTTSAGGDATEGNREDDISWADMNLTGSKNKENTRD
jgi:hypothetical protein